MHLKPRIHPDSVITMADGSRKSITEIKIGDEVQTYDMNSEEFDAAKKKILNDTIWHKT